MENNARQEITEEQAKLTIELFEKDFDKYTLIPLESIIIEQGGGLMRKYGKQSLRKLDSMQLSVAVSLSNCVALFVTADKLLGTFFKQGFLRT